MNYPLLSDYIEAIKAAEDRSAEGRSLSENFEQLKHLRSVMGADGEPLFSRAEAYRQIAEELEYVSSTFLTPIKYLEKELFVDTNAGEDKEFPVLLMDWVEGPPTLHTISQ